MIGNGFAHGHEHIFPLFLSDNSGTMNVTMPTQHYIPVGQNKTNERTRTSVHDRTWPLAGHYRSNCSREQAIHKEFVYTPMDGQAPPTPNKL